MKYVGWFAAGIVGYVYRGWVMSLLWLWFVAGTFGVQAITLAQALGLSIAFGLLHSYVPDVKQRKTEAENLALTLYAGLVQPTLALVVGWVVHLFL
jgi:hypothetical protein